jgi:hypothetical protein
MPLQPRRMTLKRYHIVDRTAERWEKNERLGFPKPIYINGRKFDDVELLDAWDAALAARTRETRAPPAAGKPRRREEAAPDAAVNNT